MDYSRVCDHVFYCELDDLDLDVLERRGVSYKAYFPLYIFRRRMIWQNSF